MAILHLVIALILQEVSSNISLDLRQYFPVQIQKIVTIVSLYETYLQVPKALLNDLKGSYKNEA